MKKYLFIKVIFILLLTAGLTGLLGITHAAENDLILQVVVLPGLNVEVGEEVFFTGESSSYAIGDIRDAKFEWNFGDGCPLSTGMSVIHYFMKPGVYEVTMNVTIGTDVKTASVTVTVSGTEPLSGFEFLHAPFSSRTAQFITVAVPPSVAADPQNQLTVQLTKADGSDPVTLLDKTQLGSEEQFLLEQRNLQEGDYRLIAVLKNGSGTVLSTLNEKFHYNGIPAVGINEWNAICVNGDPVFIVSNSEYISLSQTSAFSTEFNTLFGSNSNTGTAADWVNYIKTAKAKGWMAAGPRRGIYSDPVTSANANNMSMTQMKEFINAYLEDGDLNPSDLLMWNWRKYPFNITTYPPVLAAWTYVTKETDPGHPVAVEVQGSKYLPSSPNPSTLDFVKSNESFGGKHAFYADILIMEALYPINNIAAIGSGSVGKYVDAIDTCISRNKNLVPVITCVEGHGFTSGRPADPTNKQVMMESWLAVVHGAKGVTFRQNNTGSAYYDTMRKFARYMETYDDIILGPESITPVTDNSNAQYNRVDTLTRKKDNYTYLFAVRLTEPDTNEPDAIETEFMVPGITSGRADILNELGSRIGVLTIEDGRFTDTFNKCDVRIYRISSISGENQPPVFDTIGEITARSGINMSFTVSATDPENDELDFSASALPVNASFDTESQTFSWTPQASDEGLHYITFTVTDGLNTVYEIIGINVVVLSPDSIAVTTPPAKIDYYVGENLDLTGLVVTGYYSDGSTEVLNITTENISGFDSNAPETGQIVTVTYEGRTATFTVNIIEGYPLDLPPQIVSFTSSQYTINLGEEITLSWNVLGAERLVLTTPRSYDMTGETSKKIIPNATMTYTLTASNSSGTATQDITVEVNKSEVTDTNVFQWPDYIFEEQMEYGDLHMWSPPTIKGGGVVELVSEPRHSGLAAMKCSIPAGAVAKNASVTRTVDEYYDVMYARIYIYFDHDFNVASGQNIDILSSTNTKSGATANVRIRRNASGQLILRGVGGGVTVDGTTVISKGEWYALEFCYNKLEGTFTVWLNGQQELLLTGMNLPNQVNGIKTGIIYTGSNAETCGTVYIDDVFVDTKPIGLSDPHVRLYAPDFRSRIGAKVVAILAGQEPDDRLTATLTNNSTYSEVQFYKTGPFNGWVDIPVNLRGLPASAYSLTVRLLSSTGEEKASASLTWDKSYSGDPEGYSIDENNNITFQGEKVFPVTSFGLDYSKIADWYNNNYINLLYGRTWNAPYTGHEAFGYYLDYATTVYEGAKVIGPAFDRRFDVETDTSPRGERWTPLAVLEYFDNYKDHPGLAWWMWREEPDNFGYTADEVKTWWDLVKINDPSTPMENLLMGYNYLPGKGEGVLKTMRSHHYPYLNADIYSWDIYPVENEDYGAGFEEFADAMIYSRRWNMDLVPVFPNIQTADCTPGKKGGTPTVTEFLHMCWSMVVNGAKGIHWYPYQGETPPEILAAMAKFVNDTTALVEVICGEEIKDEVTMTLSNNGRVDYVTKTDGKDIYIMAVNIKRANETATFDLGNINAEFIEVYGEGRAIQVSNGKFSDNFTDLAYHIYKINTADEQPTGVVISGEGVTETPDGRTLSLVAGSEMTLSATLLPMNVECKDAIWSSSNEEVATVDENGKVTALIEGTAVIKVMVKTAGNELIGECILTVTPKGELLNIAVTTPPEKTTYYVGEALDLTGLVVTGTFDDGTTEELMITLDNISGFDSSMPAEAQIVTITYGGKTSTFTVNILNREGYEFVIENVSLNVDAGITAQATITPIIPGGRNAVIIFKLIQGDTVLGLYSGELPIVDSVNFKVKFHGYSGDQYKVKVYVWDKLDDSVDSIGVDLALPIEIGQ